MKQIKARDLLRYSVDELWDSLYGDFKLEFDDGKVIDTNYKETLYSSYFWEFHRRYPDTPLLPKHHLKSVLGDNSYLNSKTHIKLLKSIYWDVCDVYGAHTPIERDHFTKMIYEITNFLYNDLPPRIEEYMLTLDALDFINLTIHPDMDKILQTVTEERSVIDKVYNEIMDVLYTDESLKDNALVKCVRYGTVNRNQVLQCTGPRGFVTEVDSAVLGKPITRSFTQGMRTIYNMTAESRSAAKALYYSEKPLQDSEYFARKLQLLTISVERLHYCDCGSKRFLHWKVHGPDNEGYKGDLVNLVGKYYLLEDEPDDAPLKVIKESDTHLIGKTIKMRSVLYCEHPDRAGVCEVCFGEMAYNLNQRGNLGHNCAASMTSVISQMVLSTKHHDASAKSEIIHLTSENMKYFTIDKNKIYYKLKKNLASLSPKIMVNQNYVHGLSSLDKALSVDELNLSSISNLKNIILVLTEPSGTVVNVPIDLSQNKKLPMFSHDFLEYARRYRWTIFNNQIVFDMKMWDYNKSIMKFPELERNYAAYQQDVKGLIETDKDEAIYRENNIPPSDLLIRMFDMINHKQQINISLMEVVIYALTITDPANGYYGLARFCKKPHLGVHETCVLGRSLSAAYAFEEQEKSMLSPRAFYEFDRPDSLFDVFITPNEVISYNQ